MSNSDVITRDYPISEAHRLASEETIHLHALSNLASALVIAHKHDEMYSGVFHMFMLYAKESCARMEEVEGLLMHAMKAQDDDSVTGLRRVQS